MILIEINKCSGEDCESEENINNYLNEHLLVVFINNQNYDSENYDSSNLIDYSLKPYFLQISAEQKILRQHFL